MLASACLVAVPGAAAPRRPAPPTEVLWDSFGVPHITGRTEPAVFKGFGWAQAKNHGDVILRLYAQARGRAAEYFGEKYLADDKWTRGNGIPAIAARWYTLQTPSFRRDLDAFADGINAWAAAHPETLDPAVRRVLPVSAVDVLAHSIRLVNFIYIAPPERVLAEGPAGGSNAWAIAPKKTASGHAMLLMNPHLSWTPGHFTYFEAQLTGPGFSHYGATLVGLPIVRFAFDERHGFTNTVNTILGATSYRLVPEAGGYRFDGKVLPFRTETLTAKVRQPDGSLKTVSWEQRHTVHGPVFARPDGTLLALRVAGLDRPGMFEQYFAMAKARSFAEFQAALRRHQTAMFNIVYADREGHVMYLDNGILPRHPGGGDFATWSKPVAGDTSATLWHDIHSYDEMPKVIDPPGGFVQNANDPPWVASWPATLKPQDFPAHVAPRGPESLRAQMSVHQLADHDRLTYEQVLALKLDTTALMAKRLLPALTRAAAASDDALVRRAGEVLAAWDGRYEAEARGALLFECWARLFAGENFANDRNYAARWSAERPIDTPDGLADPAAAAALLHKAAEQATALYGAIDTPFGQVSRFAIDGVNLPGNGGFGNMGLFRTITWGPLKGGQRTPVHGETWVALIEFGAKPRAMGVLSYGNASQPGSPHRSDQLRFISAKQLRPLWLTRREVMAHLEARDAF